MIIKRLELPLKILINEALLRRLLPPHPKRSKISQDLAMLKAGFRGEKEANYYLSLLPEKEFLIFHGLRLNYKNRIFQIDFLLLSPQFILLLEVKNHSGTVTFDPHFNQVTREYNGKEEGFEDPIVQAKRHQYQICHWMKEQKLPPLPIDFLVAYSNSATILKNPSHSEEVYNKVCLVGNLLFKINDFKSKYPKEVLSSKDLKKWSNTLLKKHNPEIPTYTAYNIPQNEIMTGVQCPECSRFKMYRIIGYWKCPACGGQSKDAHVPAVQDYFLLISPSISNLQFREFLHVPQPKLASKLLTNMNLIPTGARKNKVYYPRGFY